MPYKVRTFTCSCGVVFTKAAPSGAKPLCITCSVERSAAHAVQLHQHQGPAYAAWLDRMHQLTGCPLAGLGKGGHLPPSPDSISPGIPTSTTG